MRRADVRTVASETSSASQQEAETGGGTENRQSHNGDQGGRTLTLKIPVPSPKRVASEAVNTALLPVAVARDVLPAKGGLPLYIGLGALGAAEVIEWPVAIGIGVGYAVLRRSGPLAPPPRAARA